jgi:hypothetical protein
MRVEFRRLAFRFDPTLTIGVRGGYDLPNESIEPRPRFPAFDHVGRSGVRFTSIA